MAIFIFARLKTAERRHGMARGLQIMDELHE
jgi:hypothetical protein